MENQIVVLSNTDLQTFKKELVEEIQKLIPNSLNLSENQKKWLKSPEVMDLLQISPGTLQTFRLNGSLPFSKIGGVLFYSSEDIDKMLENNKKNHEFLKNPQNNSLKTRKAKR